MQQLKFKQLQPKNVVKYIQRTQEEHDQIIENEINKQNLTSYGLTSEDLQNLLLYNFRAQKSIEQLISNESKEFRKISEIYSDLHYGDYLLVFDNPDDLQQNQQITFKQCQEIFDECLIAQTENQSQIKDQLQEKLAFLKAFKQLKEYIPTQNVNKRKKSRRSILKPTVNYTIQQSQEVEDIVKNHQNQIYIVQNDQINQQQDIQDNIDQQMNGLSGDINIRNYSIPQKNTTFETTLQVNTFPKVQENIQDENQVTQSQQMKLTKSENKNNVINIQDEIPKLEKPQILINNYKPKQIIFSSEMKKIQQKIDEQVAQNLLEQFNYKPYKPYKPNYKSAQLPKPQLVKIQHSQSNQQDLKELDSNNSVVLSDDQAQIGSELNLNSGIDLTKRFQNLEIKQDFKVNLDILANEHELYQLTLEKANKNIQKNDNIQYQDASSSDLPENIPSKNVYSIKSGLITNLNESVNIIPKLAQNENLLVYSMTNMQENNIDKGWIHNNVKRYQKHEQNSNIRNSNFEWFNDLNIVNNNFQIKKDIHLLDTSNILKRIKTRSQTQINQFSLFNDIKNLKKEIKNNFQSGYRQMEGKFIKIGGKLNQIWKQIYTAEKKNTLQLELELIKKSYCQGGFLEKQYITKKDFDWVYNSKKRTGDFMTLIRNTVILKLSQAGLHTRQFISSDGKHIFVVVKSNEQLLKKYASKIKFRKQLELGSCDLFSLEPIDESFRPLRVKDFINAQRNEQTGRFQGSKAEGSIENIMHRTYQLIKKLPIDKLQNALKIKTSQIDLIYEKIQQELRCNYIKSNESSIQQDVKLDRKIWEIYYIYLDYLHHYYTKLDNLRKVKQKSVNYQMISKLKYYPEFQNQYAFLMRLIFTKAKNDANKLYYDKNKISWLEYLGIPTAPKCILKNIFDHIDVLPFPPYATYEDIQHENNLGISAQNIWRNFEISETGQRSIFSNMEKLKITHIIIEQTLNIPKLLNYKLLNCYVPIHDCYQLSGDKKIKLFQKFFDADLIEKNNESQGQILLKEFYKLFKDNQSQGDFNSQSLIEEANFNIYSPWNLQIDSIRDYFGEKIALYFNFLIFYTKQLILITLVGVVVYILENKVKLYSNEHNQILFIFSLILTLWSSVFTELWKREQYRFCIRYGQEKHQKEEVQRASFKGIFIRSLGKDILNQKFYAQKQRIFKQLASIFLSFCILAVVIVIVFSLFLLKDYLTKNQVYKEPITFLNNKIPSIINSIQILIFNEIYQFVAIKCNEQENHSTLSSYENSLIVKIFAFVFVNTFNSLFIIAFMKQQLNWDCSQSNCFDEVKDQIQSIFLVNFIKNGVEVLMPLIKQYRRKAAMIIDEIPQEHIFNDIDNYLEKQFILEPYKTTDELDGTIGEYMEMIVQYSFLSLFGLAFPLSFLLAFINNIVEIQVDKIKLMKFAQRPIPQGANDIGTWYFIMQFISFLSILTNAGLICFTSNAISEKNQKTTFFSILIINLLIKYSVQFIIPDKPSKIILFKKRYNVVVDKFLKGFQSNKKVGISQVKPNSEIINVLSQEQAENIRKNFLSDKIAHGKKRDSVLKKIFSKERNNFSDSFHIQQRSEQSPRIKNQNIYQNFVNKQG